MSIPEDGSRSFRPETIAYIQKIAQLRQTKKLSQDDTCEVWDMLMERSYHCVAPAICDYLEANPDGHEVVNTAFTYLFAELHDRFGIRDYHSEGRVVPEEASEDDTARACAMLREVFSSAIPPLVEDYLKVDPRGQEVVDTAFAYLFIELNHYHGIPDPYHSGHEVIGEELSGIRHVVYYRK